MLLCHGGSGVRARPTRAHANAMMVLSLPRDGRRSNMAQFPVVRPKCIASTHNSVSIDWSEGIDHSLLGTTVQSFKLQWRAVHREGGEVGPRWRRIGGEAAIGEAEAKGDGEGCVCRIERHRRGRREHASLT